MNITSFLLICLLCVLATVKSLIFSVIGKKRLNTLADGILINGLVFTAAALLFLRYLPLASWQTALFGVTLGVLSVLYQLAYTTALASGPLSLTALINNLAMVIPIGVSAIAFKEPLSGFRLAGIALTAVALIINTRITKGEKLSKKWALLVAMSFSANGLVASTTKIYSQTVGSTETYSFVACSYTTAALLAAAVYLTLKFNGKPKTCKYTPSLFIFTAAAGIILGSFQSIYTYSSTVIDGTLLFPAYNGGFTLLVTLAGVIVFKERLRKKQWLGVAIGAVAILLMCL